MTVKAELIIADVELRRFIREQYSNHLGYPKMAAFARNVSRGTVSLPPIQDDPVMNCVGAFYMSLKPIERRALTEYYLVGHSLRKCSRALSQSVGRFKRGLEKLMWRCFYWLKGAGFA